MFIATERTPNPATLKFLPGRQVMPDGGTANFPDAAAAAASPLAEALFALGGVTGVFFGADFISVSKAEDAEWTELKPQVLALLVEHFSASAPLFRDDEAPAEVATADDPADAEIVHQIKTLIEEKVRPAVARDGGDILYQGFRDGVVYLRMQGACSGCPSATMTLKQGIENLLRYYIPEVVEVRPVAS
ncbi:MAG: NifU family protein [Rhodothalassiaceae bacterium]